MARLESPSHTCPPPDATCIGFVVHWLAVCLLTVYCDDVSIQPAIFQLPLPSRPLAPDVLAITHARRRSWVAVGAGATRGFVATT